MVSNKFRSAYNYGKRNKGIECKGGLTRQSAKDECDVNRIVSRYRKTGDMSLFEPKNKPQYRDVSGVDFQSMMNSVADANSRFEELPIPDDLRSQFSSPQDFVDYCNDPENAESLVDMGLGKFVSVKSQDLGDPEPRDPEPRDPEPRDPEPRDPRESEKLREEGPPLSK